MFAQVRFTPQVKRNLISSIANLIYELPHELSNHLKNLRKLGSIWKIWIWVYTEPSAQPAGMRCPWEISIKSLLKETSQRPLRNISKEMTFCDSFKRSQIYLKKSFLWPLEDVSKTSQKRHLLYDVSKMSRAYLKKDDSSVTSLRRLKNTSRKYLWFFKNEFVIAQKWFRVIFARLLQYLIK